MYTNIHNSVLIFEKLGINRATEIYRLRAKDKLFPMPIAGNQYLTLDLIRYVKDKIKSKIIDRNKYIDIKEMAKIIGNISPASVYHRIYAAELKKVMINGKSYYPRKEALKACYSRKRLKPYTHKVRELKSQGMSNIAISRKLKIHIDKIAAASLMIEKKLVKKETLEINHNDPFRLMAKSVRK